MGTKNVDEMAILPNLLEAAVFGSESAASKAAGKIRNYLDSLTDSQMIRLSEEFRERTSMEWKCSWEKANIEVRRSYFVSDSDYAAVITLGTFHPNGYFREQCIRAAAVLPQMLPFVLLRLNDWVEKVRSIAKVQADQRLREADAGELLSSIAFLEKLQRSGRRDQVFFDEFQKQFFLQFEEKLSKLEERAILQQPYERRKALYRFLRRTQCQIFLPEYMEKLIEKEKNGYLKYLLFQSFLQNYSCSDEYLEQYLQNTFWLLRRSALYKKFERVQGVWEGLEQFLLDPYRSIREYAVFVLKKYGDIDIRAYYTAQLNGEKRVEAVFGLGETGRREDTELLRGFLNSSDPKLVRAVLYAFGHLLGSDGEKEYLRFLTDERVSISKTAYRCIVHSNTVLGVKTLYEIINGGAPEHVKRYTLNLLFRERSWKRIPYLLQLLGKLSKEQDEQILEALGKRNMYETVSAKEADWIRRLLQQENPLLPEPMKKGILFDLTFVEK